MLSDVRTVRRSLCSLQVDAQQCEDDTSLRAFAQTNPALKTLGARKCHHSRAALPRPARFAAPRPIPKALTAGQVTVVFLRLLAYAVVAKQTAVATAPLPGWPTPTDNAATPAAPDTAADNTTDSKDADNIAADTVRPEEETVATPATEDASSPSAAPAGCCTADATTTTTAPAADTAAAADTEATTTAVGQDVPETHTDTDTAAVAGTWQPAPEAEANVCDACLSDTCGSLARTESIVSQASHASIDLASSSGSSSSLASKASSDLDLALSYDLPLLPSTSESQTYTASVTRNAEEDMPDYSLYSPTKPTNEGMIDYTLTDILDTPKHTTENMTDYSLTDILDIPKYTTEYMTDYTLTDIISNPGYALENITDHVPTQSPQELSDSAQERLERFAAELQSRTHELSYGDALKQVRACRHTCTHTHTHTHTRTHTRQYLLACWIPASTLLHAMMFHVCACVCVCVCVHRLCLPMRRLQCVCSPTWTTIWQRMLRYVHTHTHTHTHASKQTSEQAQTKHLHPRIGGKAWSCVLIVRVRVCLCVQITHTVHGVIKENPNNSNKLTVETFTGFFDDEEVCVCVCMYVCVLQCMETSAAGTHTHKRKLTALHQLACIVLAC